MRYLLALLGTLLVTSPLYAQSVRVSVDGEVAHPGTQTLPTDSRLAQALIAASPTSDAYPTAAVFLRPSERHSQLRQKAGLLHDLDMLAASTDGDLAILASELAAWVRGLPVTGRIPAELSPRRAEITPGKNPTLLDGDSIHYPMRPTHVLVVGAVQAPCRMDHVPLQEARDYVASCTTRLADRDRVFVIQPDGRTFQVGVALWNRDEAQSLAPGAVLYVPLDRQFIRQVDADLNEAFAAFLATQPAANIASSENRRFAP
ncbi:hypothetical protein AO715_02940 [Xanthomonas sp. Mitacek01]|nr:hypothetical protein AO715_02940 [Xanthomonas sp. Mitacek01]